MAILKTPEEIKIMAEAGKILAQVLQALRGEIKEGITTNSINKLVKKLIEEAGASPAFLGYQPTGNGKAFPAAICASKNEVVVHGLPDEEPLRAGDIITIDAGVKYKNFYADSAFTLAVGNIPGSVKKLLSAAEEALMLGIKAAVPGGTIGDIGFAIQNRIKKDGFSVVKHLTGHGIGKNLHESPNVLNTGRPGRGEEIKVGMVLAVEPMVSMGGGEIEQLDDDSFKMKDGSLSAHFEHTIAITEKGPEILTKI